MPTTDHPVIPFDRDEEGILVPGEAVVATKRDAAKRRAMARFEGKQAGSLAFRRTGDRGAPQG